MKKEIVILHISQIDDSLSSGVAVVVPEHLASQSKYVNIGLLKLNDNDNIKTNKKYLTFEYKNEYQKISLLPEPFNRPDLVVFHEIYRPQYIMLSKELTKIKVPYIIVPHGGLMKSAQKKKWYKKIPANILVLRKFYKNAKAIQYLSDTEKQKSILKNKTSFVSGNGVTIKNTIVNDDCQKYFNMIYIGRYDIYYKGLDILLSACGSIKEEMEKNNILLNLYGVGEDKKILKAMVEKYSLENSVKVNGPIYGKEKEKVLRESKIFIQTSRSEGQPLSILEALSYGLPIIATPGTTFTSEIEENHLGFTTELNKFKIASTILLSYKNRNTLNRISKNAQNYIAEKYDWTIVSKKAIEQYKKYF